MEKGIAYIAGAVTGLDMEDVRKKFAAKEAELRTQGYAQVYNPIRMMQLITRRKFKSIDSWEGEMRECIKWLAECDELHLLPCWENSRGAQLEKHIAEQLGMTIVYP